MNSLARIAGRLGLSVEVATLDHGLREQSAAEVEGVVGAARRLGLVAHARTLALPPGAGIEGRGREVRYAALEAIRVERHLGLIATAHTASDQAETVLMRLARGAALGGASAIQARTPTLIRPLLALTRAEVIEYLRALGQSWVEDPMNEDPKFLRVRVRRELLPLYEATAGPRVARHLARFAQYAAEDEALLDRQAGAALERVSGPAGLDALGVDALERPIRRRVIARWLSGHQLAVDAPLLEDVIEAVTLARPATLPRDQLLVNQGGWLTLQQAPSRNFTDRAGVGGDDGL
jgi:tRNA(Ile)-lysidine synthase